MTNSVLTSNGIVVINDVNGHSVVAEGSLLRRVRFFDGQFLDASKLQLEQQALLNQVHLSNQAGGAGLVYGFHVSRTSGDKILVERGLAIDPQGRLLYLPDEVNVGIADLIEKSQVPKMAVKEEPSSKTIAADFNDCLKATTEATTTAVASPTLYLITIGHMEAYCGSEDVFGKLCEEACITSTERPYIIEGVVIRAVHLNLTEPLISSNAIALTRDHLRSRVASAYYEQKQKALGSMISKDGLHSGIWCRGAEVVGDSSVPIAVVARAGSETLFVDAWIARRERMETPPRHYWAGRMAMRPWNVFLAQVLQFQCQLLACIQKNKKEIVDFDPCQNERETAVKALEMLNIFSQNQSVLERFTETESTEEKTKKFSLAEFNQIKTDLATIISKTMSNRYLINCGFVELPSAGYLPVSSSSTLTVNEQVRRMMGEGVDLRFCVVRPDYVPHALEEAQHMKRISLLQGLDDPSDKPQVDVLVPDGLIDRVASEAAGRGYEMSLQIGNTCLELIKNLNTQQFTAKASYAATKTTALAVAAKQVGKQTMKGAARGEQLDTGGYAFYFAGKTETVSSTADTVSAKSRIQSWQACWTKLRIDQDPFVLARGQSTHIEGKVVWVLQTVQKDPVLVTLDIHLNGLLTVEEILEEGARGKLKTRLDTEDGVVRIRSSNGTTEPDQMTPINIGDTVIIRRQPSSGVPSTIVVTAPNPSPWARLGNIVLAFERCWLSSEEAEIDATRKTGTAEASKASLLYSGRQKENDSVLQPGHDLHSASLEALKRIGSALQDKKFAAQKARQLFAPPEPVPDSLRVFGTCNWVLFHRRRDIQCEYAVQPSASIQPRRYRVFYTKLTQSDDIEVLASALGPNGTITLAKFDLKPVTSVSFEAGIHSLLNSQQDAREEWKALILKDHTDAEIVFGAIASSGAALDEGETLALARLEHLVQVLGPVTELASEADLATVGEVPDSLTGGEIDGVIVLATLEVATICHQLYRLEVTGADLEQLLKNSGGNNFMELLKKSGAYPLNLEVKFRSGTIDFFGEQMADDIVKTWEKAGNGALTATINIAHANIVGESEETVQPVRGQAARIATVAGTDIDSANVKLVKNDADLSACPAITVLTTEPQIEMVCNDIHYLMQSTRAADVFFDSIVQMITNEEKGYQVILDAAETGKLLLDALTIMEFNAGTADTTSESIDALKHAWLDLSFIGDNGELPDQVKVWLLAISPQGADSETQRANLLQAQLIREKLALPDEINIKEIMNGPDIFPSTCEAITLIFCAGPSI